MILSAVGTDTLDEAPMAYKSLEDIIDVIWDSVDIIDIMKPVYNFKASDQEVPWRKKGDLVRAKKYFYVLRPVLACRWILDQGTPPPMLFSELMKAELPVELTGVVSQLLELKMNSPEVKLIPRIPEINEYLDKSILDIKNVVKALDDSQVSDWDELNQIFLQELKYWK